MEKAFKDREQARASIQTALGLPPEAACDDLLKQFERKSIEGSPGGRGAGLMLMRLRWVVPNEAFKVLDLVRDVVTATVAATLLTPDKVIPATVATAVGVLRLFVDTLTNGARPTELQLAVLVCLKATAPDGLTALRLTETLRLRTPRGTSPRSGDTLTIETVVATLEALEKGIPRRNGTPLSVVASFEEEGRVIWRSRGI